MSGSIDTPRRHTASKSAGDEVPPSPGPPPSHGSRPTGCRRSSGGGDGQRHVPDGRRRSKLTTSGAASFAVTSTSMSGPRHGTTDNMFKPATAMSPSADEPYSPFRRSLEGRKCGLSSEDLFAHAHRCPVTVHHTVTDLVSFSTARRHCYALLTSRRSESYSQPARGIDTITYTLVFTKQTVCALSTSVSCIPFKKTTGLNFATFNRTVPPLHQR